MHTTPMHHDALPVNRGAFLLSMLVAVLHAACTTSDVHQMSATDASTQDASTHDASIANTDCFSPLHPPPADWRQGASTDGCACATSAKNTQGYCVVGYAWVCRETRWQAVIDGPCAPRLVSSGWCESASGIRAPDASCPSGFAQQLAAFGSVDAAERSCCIPIEVSTAECMETGLHVVAAASQQSLLDTRCSDGSMLRAFIQDRSGASVCCD